MRPDRYPSSTSGEGEEHCPPVLAHPRVGCGEVLVGPRRLRLVGRFRDIDHAHVLGNVLTQMRCTLQPLYRVNRDSRSGLDGIPLTGLRMGINVRE